MHDAKTLLVHQFPLTEVTGVTVMIREILRLCHTVKSQSAAYLSFPATWEHMLPSLESHGPEIARVIGFNLHIEVGWELSCKLFDWCATHRIPAWVYVHDYWPHHRTSIAELERRQARIIASTSFVKDSLAADGFVAEVVPVGVPLRPVPGDRPNPQMAFASVGRLAPRKRFPDIARAFGQAKLGPEVGLYLRLFPSQVFDRGADDEQMRLIQSEIESAGGQAGRMRLETSPTDEPFEHWPFLAYVCASAYEGFSMAPLEASHQGCPPLMSDIPAHQALATALFENPSEFLYPVGDTRALADLMRDEFETQRRRAYLVRNKDRIQAIIDERWNLLGTIRAIGRLAARVS